VKTSDQSEVKIKAINVMCHWNLHKTVSNLSSDTLLYFIIPDEQFCSSTVVFITELSDFL